MCQLSDRVSRPWDVLVVELCVAALGMCRLPGCVAALGMRRLPDRLSRPRDVSAVELRVAVLGRVGCRATCRGPEDVPAVVSCLAAPNPRHGSRSTVVY